MNINYQRWIIFVIAIPLFVLIGYFAHDNSISGDHIEITDDFSMLVTNSSLDEMETPPAPDFINEIGKSDDMMLLGDRDNSVVF